MDFAEANKVFPEYRTSLKGDIAHLKRILQFFRNVRERFTDYARTHIARPDDQDFYIFFWTYFAIGDEEDAVRRELARKEHHARILSGKASATDTTTARIAQAKLVPISSLIQFNRSGFARCPWHNERTASLKYYPKDNRVYCFGCNRRADVIDITMKLFSLSFSDSIKKLSTFA